MCPGGQRERERRDTFCKTNKKKRPFNSNGAECKTVQSNSSPTGLETKLEVCPWLTPIRTQEEGENYFLVNFGRDCRAGRTVALFHNNQPCSPTAVFSIPANRPAVVPILRTRRRERRRRGGKNTKQGNGRMERLDLRGSGRVQSGRSASERGRFQPQTCCSRPKYLWLPKATAFHLKKKQINFQCC